MNGVYSVLDDINNEVPQGSCLGPILFLICINNFPFYLQSSQVTMYVDDNTLSHPSESIVDLSEIFIRDLHNLNPWLQGNISKFD